MNASIIVTDLTLFSKDGYVCIAGIDLNTGQCIRPRLYITVDQCQQDSIEIGTILNFNGKFDCEKIHSEDFKMDTPIDVVNMPLSERRVALASVFEASLDRSIVDGFNCKISENRKIENTESLSKSIITIKIDRDKLAIHKNNYKEGKIQISFYCLGEFKYLPFQQLFWLKKAMTDRDNSINMLGRYASKFKQLFLRVGIGREFKNAYWLQINTIYGKP